MAMFEMTEQHAQVLRADLMLAVQPHLPGDEVLAVCAMRRGGASASFVASKLGGGLPYAAIALWRKHRAGGLPATVVLALTPRRLHAFACRFRGGRFQVAREVAVWERAALSVRTERGLGMTNLTIESPGEGERATLVPLGVRDDPVSLELIRALLEGSPAAAAG